ncbi:MAG TPA: GNAT family N-acetyltransferase [Bacteroidales bacterium]|nr:GNAT family N-acetyltransferase [Bacteroidales bacterium]
MEIAQAKPAELIEILYLHKVCILDMNRKGQKHWNYALPDIQHIVEDLREGYIYVAKDKGVCKGMVTLCEKEPEDYKQLNFSTGKSSPLYLYRMVVHPTWQGTGIAGQMVEFAQKLARGKGCNCIRLDIYQPSDDARRLCEKQSFKEVGPFHKASQMIPFICYEKHL